MKHTLQIDGDEELTFTISEDCVLFEYFNYPRKQGESHIATFGMSRSNFESAMKTYRVFNEDL